MAVPATYTGFDSHKLTGVKVTDRELGYGSYATVLELEYMGLKCAGKKIHEALLMQGGASYSVRRFEEECRLLSQVRHPNIVQFLGVHFQQGVPTPILVMEFFPTNLTSCIEQYGILPKEISYSILHDVALGLCYLHGQTPPIIHRDLSSNNVLLTPNMTAKISDLGVAKILNLTPLQVSHMTQTPGTPAYMPPEVMIANPKYDTSVDTFSYGILMIHMFSGRWPEPQVGQTRFEGTQLVPVTEAERREVFLQAIGYYHPLMDLILKCIDNHPQTRAHASEIVEQLAMIVSLFPPSFSNRLDMLRKIEDYEEKKHTLNIELETEILKMKDQVLNKESQLQCKIEEVQQKTNEMARLKMAHLTEAEQLQIQVKELKSQKQQLSAEREAEVEELMSKATLYEAQVERHAKTLQHERQVSKDQLAKEREHFETEMRKERKYYKRQTQKERKQFEVQLAKEKEHFEIDIQKHRELYELKLTKEKDMNKKLVGDVRELQSDLSKSLSEINTLQSANVRLAADVVEKDNAILVKEASMKRKDEETEAKSRALQQKEITMLVLTEQLRKVREFLSTSPQVIPAGITWNQCAELPIKLHSGKTTVINGKVYCGGGRTDDDNYSYIVYCYDPSQDNWTTLPPLPVKYFSLGQVSGKLVAVGGANKSDERSTNKIFTYDERSRKWKQTLPPMPTARYSPGVLSHQSALVVAGGYSYCTTLSRDLDIVEIFKADTSQWCRAGLLPTACQDYSTVVIGNTCYALGGYMTLYPSNLNQVLYASVDDLLRNAVPANQATQSGSSANTQSAWKTLANTPTYQPATAVLAGNLLAIGVKETPGLGPSKSVVYMFSSSTNSWIYVSNLPEPLSFTTVAVLSSTELLVIGGWTNNGRVNTVYKGALTFNV